jgi:hypothetical protein
MIYPMNRKPNRDTFSERTRVVTVAKTRPLLDLHLGAALWKDRRVSPAVKLLALSVGVLTIAALVAVDYLLARWMVGPQAFGQLSFSSLALSGGAVLFSTITLLLLAPVGVVNLVRLERLGAIPLRINRN